MVLLSVGLPVPVVSQLTGDKGPRLTDGAAASTQEGRKTVLPVFYKNTPTQGWLEYTFSFT